MEDVMFESFRVGNVPVCKVADSLTDPFNIDNYKNPFRQPVDPDTAGEAAGSEFGDEEDIEDNEDIEDEEETLF